MTSARGVGAVAREAAAIRQRDGMAGGPGTHKSPMSVGKLAGQAASSKLAGQAASSHGEDGQAAGEGGGMGSIGVLGEEDGEGVGSGGVGEGGFTPAVGASRPGSALGKRTESKGERSAAGRDLDIQAFEDSYWVAAAFVVVMRRALSDDSFAHALLAGRLAWDGGLLIGGVPVTVDSLLPPRHHEFEAKVAGYLATIKLPPPSVEFLSRCTAFYQGVHSCEYSFFKAAPPHLQLGSLVPC